MILTLSHDQLLFMCIVFCKITDKTFYYIIFYFKTRDCASPMRGLAPALLKYRSCTPVKSYVVLLLVKVGEHKTRVNLAQMSSPLVMQDSLMAKMGVKVRKFGLCFLQVPIKSYVMLLLVKVIKS